MHSYPSLKNKSLSIDCSSAESDTSQILGCVKFPKNFFSVFEGVLVKDEFTYISQVSPK